MGESLQNQEKGFLAYILCSKIAQELIETHHFKNMQIKDETIE